MQEEEEQLVCRSALHTEALWYSLTLLGRWPVAESPKAAELWCCVGNDYKKKRKTKSKWDIYAKCLCIA